MYMYITGAHSLNHRRSRTDPEIKESMNFSNYSLQSNEIERCKLFFTSFGSYFTYNLHSYKIGVFWRVFGIPWENGVFLWVRHKRTYKSKATWWAVLWFYWIVVVVVVVTVTKLCRTHNKIPFFLEILTSLSFTLCFVCISTLSHTFAFETPYCNWYR